MGNPYPVLTFKGDLSGAPSGALFGWDEALRLYEIIDAEFSGDDGECDTCGPGRTGHTHIFLQYARAETMKEQGERFFLAMRKRGLL